MTVPVLIMMNTHKLVFPGSSLWVLQDKSQICKQETCSGFESLGKTVHMQR